jgi:hypothetical protein
MDFISFVAWLDGLGAMLTVLLGTFAAAVAWALSE